MDAEERELFFTKLKSTKDRLIKEFREHNKTIEVSMNNGSLTRKEGDDVYIQRGECGYVVCGDQTGGYASHICFRPQGHIGDHEGHIVGDSKSYHWKYDLNIKLVK